MLQQIEEYCSNLLLSDKCRKLPFHNIDHTKEVVFQVNHIADYAELTDEEKEPILIAAWFHDTGHSEIYEGHEEASIRIAKKFLLNKGFPPQQLDIVLSCIEATKMPQRPSNKFAELLCDADIFHIGTSDFFYKKLLLRREWDIKGIMQVKNQEWHKLNLKFLHEHHFRSEYGKEVLEKGKLANEHKVKYILSFCD